MFVYWLYLVEGGKKSGSVMVTGCMALGRRSGSMMAIYTTLGRARAKVQQQRIGSFC